MRRYLLPLSALVVFAGMATSVSAQVPRARIAPEAWFRTVPTSSSLLGTYHWIDLSGDSVTTVSRNRNNPTLVNTNALPFLDTHSINFHPALRFSGSIFQKELALSYSSLAQGTVIGIFAPIAATSSSDAALFGLKGRNGEETLVGKDKVHHAGSGAYIDYGKAQGEDLLYGSAEKETKPEFLERFPRVVSYMWANRPVHSVWGEPKHSLVTVGSTPGHRDTRFSQSYLDMTRDVASFDGYIPEFIVFNRMLTPADRLRVESGLALRYGLTLYSSYLDSRGNLLWDFATNKTYHHRVTGIIRDDESSLLQTLSSTSYEESPNYTTEKNTGSYYQNSPYGLSSSKRTLVVGREYGSPFLSGNYLIWGDDGNRMKFHTVGPDSLLHLLDRTWLARTNITEKVDTSAARWFSQDFKIVRSGFTDALIRSGDGTEATAVSALLFGTEGSVELVCPASFPSFDIGYTTASENSCKYGFRIVAPTRIQVIEDGTLRKTIPVSSISGKRLLVRKCGNLVFLSVDGVGNDHLCVNIQENPNISESASCRAVIKAVASGALSLSDVRVTGTSVTGNMAELSYAQLKDKGREFFTGRIPLLIIDPTGSGDFTSDNIRFVRSSSTDHTREKIIFRNVFLDTDGSGSDIFSFGYYDGLKASILPHDTHCKNGTSLPDGSINIAIELGTPSYTYRLKAAEVPGIPPKSIVREGTFGDDIFTIGHLFTGLYELTLAQGGSNSISSAGTLLFHSYSEDPRSFRTGSISWVHPDLSSNVRIGILQAGSSSKSVRYGFEVRSDKVRIIQNGRIVPPAYTISTGDSLGIRLDGNGVSYYINGKDIKTLKEKIAEWSAVVNYGAGKSHVVAFKVSGAHVPEFNSNVPTAVENVGVCSITRQVRVGSECGLPSEVLSPLETRSEAKPKPAVLRTEAYDGRFFVSQDGDLTLYTRLLTETSEAATLMVFDVAGHLLSEKAYGQGTERILREIVPAPGVYIVKAITQNAEHTQKIIIK